MKRNSKFILSFILGYTFLISNTYGVMFEPKIIELESHLHPHQEIKTFNTANDLVSSKIRADITYRQMMQFMGEALKMAQGGAITQNKQIIKSALNMIDNHPAPRTNPWLIMEKKDQKLFKTSLLTYDKLLHNGTKEVLEVLESKDWIKVNQKLFELSNHCVSCHQVWKNKPIKKE